MIALELGNDEVDDALVKVLTTEEGVAVGGENLKLLFTIDISDFDDGDVKSAAAEVIDGNLAVALFVLVQAEGQRCRSRFVDDALDFQAGDAASILGGLALGVVEVGRYRDHGFGHCLAQVVLSSLFHLAQDVGADLLGRDLLAANLDPGIAIVGSGDLVGHQIDVFLDFFFCEFTPDQTLHRVQRVARIGHSLALG